MIIVSISNWKKTSQLQLENLVCLVSALAGYHMIRLNFDYLCLSDIKRGAITKSFHVGVSKQGYPKKMFFLICEIIKFLRE